MSKGKPVGMWSALSKIDVGNSGDCAPTSDSTICQLRNGTVPSDLVNTSWYPVTLLHNICQAYQWPLPVYELINEEISSTKHVFTLECKVLHHTATGVGLSKQKAKGAASAALLERINKSLDQKENSGFIFPEISVHNKKHVFCDREDAEEEDKEERKTNNATRELYELCYSFKWPSPIYGLLSVEGPMHQRIFKVGCTLSGFTELGEGSGHTKKEAKHSASRALLNKIFDGVSDNFSSSCTINTINKEQCQMENQTHKTFKNATCLLNEMCMAYKWPFPTYEFFQERGPLTRRLFTVGCSLLGCTELGAGFTKKEAKHCASLTVLLKIGEHFDNVVPLFSDSVFEERRDAHFPRGNNVPKDPTTALHEMCTSRHWPPPTYTLLSEENLPDNQKIFVIGCIVQGYTKLVKGTGFNKKTAKHLASQALLDKTRTDSAVFASELHLHTKNCICDLEQSSRDVGERR